MQTELLIRISEYSISDAIEVLIVLASQTDGLGQLEEIGDNAAGRSLDVAVAVFDAPNGTLLES